MFGKRAKVVIIDEMDFMSKIRSAMEAENDSPEDLTTSTSDAMKRANSTSNKPSTDPTQTSEETQSEDAATTERGGMSGDIDNVTPDDPNGAAAPSEDEGAGDDMGEMGMGGGEDDLGMGDDSDGMRDMGGDSGMGDTENELPPATAEQGRQIINLQTNMSAFYQKIANMLTILSNYAAPSSDPELRNLYNNCVDYVSEIKHILESAFETPITSVNYPTKLRKYVALRHAYSAILEMLNIHFSVLADHLTNSAKSLSNASDTQTSK